MMRIQIRSHGFSLTKALAERVRSRFTKALRHGARRLAEVTVRLRDINGPRRGGVDKQCQVQIQLVGAAPLVIDATDANLYAAIDQAASRSKRTLLERMRDLRSRRRSRARRHRAR